VSGRAKEIVQTGGIMVKDSYQQVWYEVLKNWKENKSKKPKVEVIKKIRNQFCGRCNKLANGNQKLRKGCCRCGGTGNINDYHYIMIVGKYAYDMDSVK
jgi:RNase P subunit RPR2